MTQLRNLAIAGLAALAIGSAAGAALADESGSFENRLSAASIGLPLGALPPAGLYTGLETAYLGMPNAVKSTGSFIPGGVGLSLPAIANAVPLLWSTGWNFLGASYGAAVVQAFYVNTTCTAANNCSGAGFFGNGGNFSIAGGDFTTANTTFSPIILSWNLGQGWFVSTGFTFMAPDGTKSGPGFITPNPDYWTYEIPFAVSYLGSNINASANFFYDINASSNGTCCAGALGAGVTSGNLFYGDLHFLWKFGKWSIGPVGAFEVQTTADTGCTAAATALGICNRLGSAGIGGLVGYDFGPVDLQIWVTDVLASQNFPEGIGTLNVFTRLGFKLWGPDAPRPLVAKN
jgi:hypothetical protein